MNDNNYDDQKSLSHPPNCLKCVHFKTTWDKYYPRSCEIFGIKSVNLPSVEIFRAQGSHCPSFKLKEGFK